MIGIPRAYRAFQLGYLAIAANFILPAISYVAAPQLAEQTVSRLNVLLGGGPLPMGEAPLWHMLAVGNVMTLGFLCLLMLYDLERFYPALPGLAFLKAFSSLYSLSIAVAHRWPAFAAIFALDGATTLLMVVLARGAYRSLRPEEPRLPAWAWLALWRPHRVQAGLERVAAAGNLPVPNLWQLYLGVLRMWQRVLFRSETVGTSSAPVRSTWRARLLHNRALRIPALLWERAIAPLDFSGLASPPWRVIRHLLGAHHQPKQLAYDLQLLALHPGQVRLLRDAAADVVSGRARDAAWLRDLCVHEGYHEVLLAAAERALQGDFGLSGPDARDPDIGLAAHLAWCASQPASPAETWRAWRSGSFRLAPS